MYCFEANVLQVIFFHAGVTSYPSISSVFLLEVSEVRCTKWVLMADNYCLRPICRKCPGRRSDYKDRHAIILRKYCTTRRVGSCCSMQHMRQVFTEIRALYVDHCMSGRLPKTLICVGTARNNLTLLGLCYSSLMNSVQFLFDHL